MNDTNSPKCQTAKTARNPNAIYKMLGVVVILIFVSLNPSFRVKTLLFQHNYHQLFCRK